MLHPGEDLLALRHYAMCSILVFASELHAIGAAQGQSLEKRPQPLPASLSGPAVRLRGTRPAACVCSNNSDNSRNSQA